MYLYIKKIYFISLNRRNLEWCRKFMSKCKTPGTRDFFSHHTLLPRFFSYIFCKRKSLRENLGEVPFIGGGSLSFQWTPLIPGTLLRDLLRDYLFYSSFGHLGIHLFTYFTTRRVIGLYWKGFTLLLFLLVICRNLNALKI